MKTEVQITTLALLCVAFSAEIQAQLPNAWQITDASAASGGTLNYSTNLTAVQQIAATNGDFSGGFDFTVKTRFVSDFGGGKTMNMAYGFGAKRLLIWFYLNSAGDLVADLDGAGVYTLTVNGTGSALYHTNEIIYNTTAGTACYLFDGLYRFTDPGAIGQPQRFYFLRSP